MKHAAAIDSLNRLIAKNQRHLAAMTSEADEAGYVLPAAITERINQAIETTQMCVEHLTEEQAACSEKTTTPAHHHV